MLIEQIIEHPLKGPGSPGRTCTPFKKNLRVDYYLLLKCCKRQCTLLPLPGPNHLQLKFNSEMQDLKRVLDLNCKEKED